MEKDGDIGLKGEERKFWDGGKNGVLILGEILMQKNKSVCDDYILTIYVLLKWIDRTIMKELASKVFPGITASKMFIYRGARWSTPTDRRIVRAAEGQNQANPISRF